MAFMGRGGFPTMGNNSGGPDNNSNQNKYYRGYGLFRFYYYVPLDNTYVIMQMIVSFIILIVGIITFLVAYKSTVIDPLENMKNTFINIYLLIIGILLIVTTIINFLSKDKKSLIKRLMIIAIVSIMVMLVFLGIKLNLDTIYTEEKFEQVYAEQNIDQASESNKKIDIEITGMSIKTEKEYYLDEYMKLYTIFKIRTYVILGIHLLLNILLIYQILRVSKIQEKKERINKDDAILFDEEENIKI